MLTTITIYIRTVATSGCSRHLLALVADNAIVARLARSTSYLLFTQLTDGQRPTKYIEMSREIVGT